MNRTHFKDLPIQSKITLLIMAITGAALFLFSTLTIFYQFRLLRETMVENLVVLAGAVSRLSPESLSFQEFKQAKELLGALSEDDDIEIAVIYSLRDEPFSVYLNPRHAVTAILPEEVLDEGHQFVFENNGYKLRVFQPIILDGRNIGTMYVSSNLNRLKQQVIHTSMILLVSLFLFLLAAQLAARRMQRLITGPVSSLEKTARQITEIGDYSVRVKRSSRDEIGGLIDNFNSMLDAIQVRDSELHQHRHNLELIVEERTEELRRRRDEALAAAQAKAEFLANMSHEIRTPMNGVIGVLSLLREAPLAEEHRRLLETASRSADSLMYVINDILDFSKIDAGMVEFESIPFNLRELMEETASLFVDTVNSKKLDIICFVPCEVNCNVEGDPTRLRQIITNLVSNAVKFTNSGQVVVRVELIEFADQRQLLRFVVSDTGIGIPEHLLSRLFDKFTQADGSTTRQYGGTGLGLSVCKQLVELQGGDIGVYSRPGEGAEFWFTLRFKTAPSADEADPVAELGTSRILVVDDNATNRMILEHYLDRGDDLVESCDSAAEALRMMRNADLDNRFFSMILIDYQMPEMDGLQLAGLIIQEWRERAPQMFILSSGGLHTELVRRAGCKALIYKPIRRAQLLDVLTGRPAADLTIDKSATERPAGPVLRGRVLLVDDEPINQKVASAILERFGLVADTASNGLEAVHKVELNDYDVVLMDIQMPELSGYEATEMIRTREKDGGRRRVTIIAMTANALESAKTRCLEVGMDDYLSKPIKPETLAERLKPWLASDLDSTTAPANDPDNSNRSAAFWNRHRALQLVGDDTLLLDELIRLFLARKVGLLQDVAEALRTGNPDRLDDSAHAYKGAVNHFASDAVRQVAFELEMKGKAGDMAGTAELFDRLETLSDALEEELRQALSVPAEE